MIYNAKKTIHTIFKGIYNDGRTIVITPLAHIDLRKTLVIDQYCRYNKY